MSSVRCSTESAFRDIKKSYEAASLQHVGKELLFGETAPSTSFPPCSVQWHLSYNGKQCHAPLNISLFESKMALLCLKWTEVGFYQEILQQIFRKSFISVPLCNIPAVNFTMRNSLHNWMWLYPIYFCFLRIQT